MNVVQREEWLNILDQIGDELSEEERRIAKALADGKSTPDVSRMLGQHRSMIWRKAQRIRARAKLAEG